MEGGDSGPEGSLGGLNQRVRLMINTKEQYENQRQRTGPG